MQIEVLDTYINGEVQVDVCKLPDGGKDYWVKGGVGYVRFTEQGFKDLSELLVNFDAEQHQRMITIHDPWQFWTLILSLMLLIFMIGVI